MPTISMFFGIIVRMYCGKAEHNPPHVHVYYQDSKAVFDVKKSLEATSPRPEDGASRPLRTFGHAISRFLPSVPA